MSAEDTLVIQDTVSDDDMVSANDMVSADDDVDELLVEEISIDGMCGVY